MMSKSLQRMMKFLKGDLIRADGRIERVDEQGCGHPVGHVRGFLYEIETIHGCTGLCKDYKHQEIQPNLPLKDVSWPPHVP
jgi:hypothetical protein